MFLLVNKNIYFCPVTTNSPSSLCLSGLGLHPQQFTTRFSLNILVALLLLMAYGSPIDEHEKLASGHAAGETAGKRMEDYTVEQCFEFMKPLDWDKQRKLHIRMHSADINRRRHTPPNCAGKK
jgi:hypothetical protein